MRVRGGGAARYDYQCQGELLRRRRRFGVSQEYIDARTRIASDGAKLLPYALVPTPDEYGLGGFEKRLPRDAFACVALIELQAYVDTWEKVLY